MMNLNNLSKMQSNRLSNWLIISVAVFSFLGLLDAGYLTASHYMAFDPGCTVFGDCDTVLKSQYSKLFGIPVQAFGVVYYLIIFILSIIANGPASAGFLRFIDIKRRSMVVIGVIVLHRRSRSLGAGETKNKEVPLWKRKSKRKG